MSISYPFITQGAVPIQGFASVGFTGSCFIPLNNVTSTLTILAGATLTPSGASQIILTDYSQQTFGSTVIITVKGSVPSSGLLYMTVHLHYGLKGTPNYGKDNSNDATNAKTGAVIIPNLQSYRFTITGHDNVGSQIADGISGAREINPIPRVIPFHEVNWNSVLPQVLTRLARPTSVISCVHNE